MNGDTKIDNSAVVKGLASAGGSIGATSKTSGSATSVAGVGIVLREGSTVANKWIQQNVTVGAKISFAVGVTRKKQADATPPDQFSVAVLEAASNAGFLRSDDPTTANALMTIDLAPGAAPRAFKPSGKADAWTVTIKPTTEPK